MNDLDEYDDEYLEPPDWGVSITDLQERKVANAQKFGKSTFGVKGVKLEDE